MLWRGMYSDVLQLLASHTYDFEQPEEAIRKIAIEAVARTRLHEYSEADIELKDAEDRCKGGVYKACGSVLRARGVLASERGQLAAARKFFVDDLHFAREHNDRWLEATVLLNLGFISLQDNRYDEAVDWSKYAYRAGVELGEENQIQAAVGNLGWAYFELGDIARAKDLFLEAESRAARLGNIRDQIKWLTTAGYVYQQEGDQAPASQSYQQALALARQINSKEDIVNALELLGHASIEEGKLNEATGYINELTPLVGASGNRADALDVLLAQGRLAAARGQDDHAKTILRSVQTDPDSQIWMRLGADHDLARLYESEGNTAATDRIYRETLATFESARDQIKNEESKLPYLSNATHIYDDYIHFLVKQGKTNEALAVADQSRARTLAQGLGLAKSSQSFQPVALHPGAIARKARATLLFYWLGQKQSYLWAITPTKTTLFPLPAQSDIAPIVERYRKALLGLDDLLGSQNEDGLALYRILVERASSLIRPDSTVVILNDGLLSRLNFETLIASATEPHYWIDDVTLVTAPSLYMLASAKPFSGPMRGGDHKLLLLGDAVSPNPDYPELRMAAFEMQQIQKHFAAAHTTVFARQAANSAAYLASAAQDYSYIHFVTHAVASRTDPLDSAIILSPATAAEDSFKLYARDIIQHPIHARLVTIAACNGSGAVSYSGEGLVGLSWAFLRAGAHNVIGGLWEVSDESTPRLMGTLYQGLEDGMTPGVALRQAKLTLLHSHSNFRKPFFWAPFQIYTGL